MLNQPYIFNKAFFMSQNLVIANKDNLVVYVFGGIDLNLATDIKVQFGAE